MALWAVLLTYAASVGVAALLLLRFGPQAAYRHLCSAMLGLAIAMTPMPLLPFGGVSDLVVGAAVAFLMVWGVVGAAMSIVNRLLPIRKREPRAPEAP